MKIIFFSILFIPLSVLAQTPIDTISITDSINSAYSPYPARAMLVPKLNITPTYIDSIRVDGKYIINEANKRWYLIVKDKKGNRRLEGNFFDEFADGHVIEYDKNGKKSAEGDYRMEKFKKPQVIYKSGGSVSKKYNFSAKHGSWKYYNSRGRLMKEDTYVDFKLKSTKKY